MNIIKWAMICGGVGFAGGFFGPMIWAPEANQGPLLGIFITGPMGVVAGAIVGCVMELRLRRHRRNGIRNERPK